jgi:hypothetical protein
MDNTVTVAIVGSGFASWGAALVLAGNDQVSAKMFDIGLTQADDIDESRDVPNAKPYEGSYFSYGVNDSRYPIELESERACSSHAFGGHSTVYSGATLYPLDCELYDWPEEGRPLSIDYSAVLAKMPLLAEHDDLEGVFKLTPAQSDLAWHPGESRGFSLAGMSRIALTEISTTSGPETPLRPFCTRDQCEEMISTGAMQYVNECYVVKVERIDNRLALYFSKNGKIARELFDAVFVGAGCVNTTAIVDRSFNLLGERHYPIQAPQSMIHALFRIPWKGNNASRRRQRNGLPELFLEVYDSKTQYPRSHTQLSPLNEQIIETIDGRLPRLFRPLVRAVRHTIYFGLSAQSDGNREMAVLGSSIVRDARGVVTQQVAITESDAERSVELIRSVRRAVFKHWRTLRMIPIPFGDAIADFFRGNRLGGWHFGGTLPMRSRPTEDAECWPSGEVNGLNGVFILDSAAFPSIPGSTVALLSAAHGHRVARSWLSRHQGCGD